MDVSNLVWKLSTDRLEYIAVADFGVSFSIYLSQIWQQSS